MDTQLNSEFPLILTAAFALVFLVVAACGWRTAMRWQQRASQLEIELAASAHYAEHIEALKAELEEEEQARSTAEQRVAALTQELKDHQDAQATREKQIEDFKQAARASVMQAGSELSSKLLEDHKREAKQQREEQEKLTKQATDKLFEDFSKISQSVAAIHAQSTHNREQMNTVMRALTNPASAGQLSEIGLENALKNLGLQPGQDFMMQYHLETEGGSRLRPDAVIFLPQDMVMVVDSKASQSLIKLAEAEGTEHEQAVLAEFVKSTQQHIDALGRKQYADEVAAMLKKKGRTLGFLFNAMYIHSDAAIEKLCAADAQLRDRCERAGLFLVGPAGLYATFSLARQQIAAARRDENQQQIIEQVRSLMGNLATTLGYVEGVGKNIQQAARKFGDFAKSMNRNILPKLRQMEQMGVEPAKNKQLPASIAFYDVIDHSETLSAEAAELPDSRALEEPATESA